jgi:hypothetical protein
VSLVWTDPVRISGFVSSRMVSCAVGFGQNSDFLRAVGQRLGRKRVHTSGSAAVDDLDHGSVLRLVETLVPAKVIETTHAKIVATVMRQHAGQRNGR